MKNQLSRDPRHAKPFEASLSFSGRPLEFISFDEHMLEHPLHVFGEKKGLTCIGSSLILDRTFRMTVQEETFFPIRELSTYQAGIEWRLSGSQVGRLRKHVNLLAAWRCTNGGRQDDVKMNKWCTKSRRNMSLYVCIYIYMNILSKVFPRQFEFLSHQWMAFCWFHHSPWCDLLLRAPSGLSREGLQRVEPCEKLGIHQSAAWHPDFLHVNQTEAWLQAAQWWRGQGW